MGHSTERVAVVRARVVVALGGVAALAFGGCSSSGGSTAPVTGSLTVTITAPTGVTPSVSVSGPSGYHQTLTTTQTLAGLAAGSYAVSAGVITVANPVVATVYTGTATGSPATVSAGGTAMASVSYAAEPGSGALWVSNGSAATVLAYTATQLAASTSAAPATAVGTGINNVGVAIDASGNLWAAHGSANIVVEYTASQLATSGSPTPAATLSNKAGSLNGSEALAFDGSGNLWVANADGNTLVEFTAGQLAATGAPTPAVTVSDNGAGSLSAPFGLAFDRSGNLWVCNLGNTVVAYSPTQLAASGSPTPAVTLSADGSGSINQPLDLAFDGGGNLWVANYGANTVVEFTSSQLGSSGSPTPAVTLATTVGGLNGPRGLAFDAGGDLWVANNTSNTVLAFATSQLVASGAPTPTVTVSGSSISGPLGLAFDPHAGNLPLK